MKDSETTSVADSADLPSNVVTVVGAPATNKKLPVQEPLIFKRTVAPCAFKSLYPDSTLKVLVDTTGGGTGGVGGAVAAGGAVLLPPPPPPPPQATSDIVKIDIKNTEIVFMFSTHSKVGKIN